MKKQVILELDKKGTDFGFKVPKDTLATDITTGLALFIIDSAKYRGIKSERVIAEIQQWVKQLEEHL